MDIATYSVREMVECEEVKPINFCTLFVIINLQLYLFLPCGRLRKQWLLWKLSECRIASIFG